jgi:L-fuconolactonase
MTEPDRARFRTDGFDDLFAAAQEAGIPLCIYPTETLALVARAARRFPELMIVVDHLGLTQRPVAARGDDVWAPLDDLLALADDPNVAVKLSGIPALSWQPHPYPDVWRNVHRVLAAFGSDRVMWGSDCTRVDGVLTYAQGLGWLTEAGELSEDALAPLLGGTLRRVFGWPS